MNDTPSAQATTTTPSATTTNPAPSRPNHLDLYLLIIGVLLGIVLGPAVLGRLSPETYSRYFGSVEVAAIQLASYDRDLVLKHMINSLAGETGESQTPLDTQTLLSDPGRQPYIQQMHNAHASRGRLMALLVAVVVVMVLETLPSNAMAWMRHRLITARYALIALTIALLLAQPDWMTQLPLLLLFLLLTAVLVAALVPLGSRRQAGV